MFPFDVEDEEIEDEQEEEREPKDYEIDRKTGKLTGRIITGVKAIEQWIYITLATDRYFYTQYSWDHGCELNSLIGKHVSQEYVDTEAKRMIAECLEQCRYIKEITVKEVDFDDDKLKITVEINTIYGRETIYV